MNTISQKLMAAGDAILRLACFAILIGLAVIGALSIAERNVDKCSHDEHGMRRELRLLNEGRDHLALPQYKSEQYV